MPWQMALLRRRRRLTLVASRGLPRSVELGLQALPVLAELEGDAFRFLLYPL